MIRRRFDEAMLLARTTRNLRVSQVLHRMRLRAQRFPPSNPVGARLLEIFPPSERPAAGWPAAFVPFDLDVPDGLSSPEDNLQGRFIFLHDARDLGRPVDWSAPGAARLWQYHLHYMEWAWAFTSHPDRLWAQEAFAELWRSWARSTAFGCGDAWSPYVASLRAWVLCGTFEFLVRGTAIQVPVEESLARHARFLRWHVEHDVGGNHLLKNLKALVGLGVFLDDDRPRKWATAALRREVGVQVLSDGGHYERSPSYHCQVLADLIDVSGLLAAAGHPPEPDVSTAIDAMRKWLGTMLMPDGDVPLFNDCVRVGPARVSALHPGSPPDERLMVLPASGYIVMRPDDRLHLIADVGDPCPQDLPAHAHADCLNFELAVDGERLVVDSGTSTYEPSPQRAHERSTLAHNTVTVDGADQTEVGGTFRAARLAHGRLETAEEDDDGGITVCASHDGYHRLPGAPRHRRTWRVIDQHVVITDEVLGRGEHRIESRLHLSTADRVKVTWLGPPGLRVTEGPGEHATGFGYRQHGHVVSAAWHGPLPVSLQLELHMDRPGLQGSADSSHQAETVKGPS